MSVTQKDRDRAHRLGTLAARADRGPGVCPYDAAGDADERVLALVFVRGFVRAGGTVDGLDFGDGSGTRTRAPRPTGPRGSFGHLGLPL